MRECVPLEQSYPFPVSRSDSVMNEALDSIKESQDPDQALNLVKLAADFSLQSTSKLAEKVQKEFQLSEEQR